VVLVGLLVCLLQTGALLAEGGDEGGQEVGALRGHDCFGGPCVRLFLLQITRLSISQVDRSISVLGAVDACGLVGLVLVLLDAETKSAMTHCARGTRV
jgi:hypothetical protein